MRVFVDGRCLQDPNFTFRGVGLHTVSILKQAKTYLPGPVELICILDETLPEMPACHAALFDRFQKSRVPAPSRERNVFLQASPMTHDASAMASMLTRPAILTCAIVYDFIPLDEPGYLPTPAARRRFLANLYWLKLHDLFYPISQYSESRLRELLAVDPSQVAVTGASIRPAFAQFSTQAIASVPLRSKFGKGEYCLQVGGNDKRKNQVTVLTAHARLLSRGQQPFGLVLVGHHSPDFRQMLLQHYLEQGGRAEAIEFVDGVSDEELASLYHHARVAICPSWIEGFSLPVVEAIACQCPVLASSNEAHRELVLQEDALFKPGDSAALEKALQRMLEDPGYRDNLLQRQAPVSPRFAEEEVGRRLWTHVGKQLRRPTAPAVRSPDLSRPRLAVLSPYPPDRSGVADYTAISLEEVARHACVDVFTEAKSPRQDPWVRRYFDVSDLAYLQSEYDSVLAVVGNSDFHWRILQLHKRYGGACLMHDNRLAELYAWKLGLNGFARMASDILGRGVSLPEAEHWLRHPGKLPALFFDELLLRADPLIVHSRGIQAHIAHQYKFQTEYLPFCCYRHIADNELTDEPRTAARARIGVPSDRVLIISLGMLTRVKGIPECIYATEQLRSWGVPAELHLVGSPSDMKEELLSLAERLKVSSHVRLMQDWTTEQEYQDYLLSADYAIQLRAHGFGGLSGAVMDCITAGLPTVVNEDLATAMDSPDYVLRVPDNFSPLLIAEQIYLSWKAGRHHVRLGRARSAYLEEHSFERYAKLMMKVLGLAA